MPRIFGCVFNPLSIYFCEDERGRLVVMLYEVSNTFGERHFYVLRAPVSAAGGVFQQTCSKGLLCVAFEVEGDYHFRPRLPAETFAIVIDHRIKDELVLTASQKSPRRPLDGPGTFADFAGLSLDGHPDGGGDHWEALKIWRKKVPLRPRPAPPIKDASFG
jgi:hypothetical protein